MIYCIGKYLVSVEKKWIVEESFTHHLTEKGKKSFLVYFFNIGTPNRTPLMSGSSGKLFWGSFFLNFQCAEPLHLNINIHQLSTYFIYKISLLKFDPEKANSQGIIQILRSANFYHLR